MVCLYIEAPFAVCRTFTAGWYRPTATFLTPSMVYGLLLNLAGVEMRLREEEEEHPGNVPASVLRSNLPQLSLAIGVPDIDENGPMFPSVQTMFQQLHNYPVGTSGKEHAEHTFGNKYNIAPVRREFLSDIRAAIVFDAPNELSEAIKATIEDGPNSYRYGLPFLGDNSFIPDRLTLLSEIPSARWYERISKEDEGIRDRTSRLTTWIDRQDSSGTHSDLFAPTTMPSSSIPDAAWVKLPPIES